MNTEYRKLKNLFLRQSCQDAWEDYARSIRKVNFPRWDYVILTSSNEEQARSFRSQIADRLEQGVLPGWTKYFVQLFVGRKEFLVFDEFLFYDTD